MLRTNWVQRGKPWENPLLERLPAPRRREEMEQRRWLPSKEASLPFCQKKKKRKLGVGRLRKAGSGDLVCYVQIGYSAENPGRMTVVRTGVCRCPLDLATRAAWTAHCFPNSGPHWSPKAQWHLMSPPLRGTRSSGMGREGVSVWSELGWQDLAGKGREEAAELFPTTQGENVKGARDSR